MEILNIINKIYRVRYMKNHFSYVGLLRNEKRFNINDIVFFSINNHDISCGKIVGVELPPINNPEYYYKIELPEVLIRQNMDVDKFSEGKELNKVELICDHIFNSIQEAKESAITNLNRMEELQREEIESYFSQFESKNLKTKSK